MLRICNTLAQGGAFIDKRTDSWGAIVTKELALLVSKTDFFSLICSFRSLTSKLQMSKVSSLWYSLKSQGGVAFIDSWSAFVTNKLGFLAKLGRLLVPFLICSTIILQPGCGAIVMFMIDSFYFNS